MKTQVLIAGTLFMALTIVGQGQPTVFTYQGRLTSGGEPFSGVGRVKLALVDAGTNLARTAEAKATVTGGFVTAVAVVDGGSGYTSAPKVLLEDATGKGAVLEAVVAHGVVTGITVRDAGSGYSSSPTLRVDLPPPHLAYVSYWSNDGTSVGGSEPGAGVEVTVREGLLMLAVGDTTLTNMAAVPAAVFLNPAVHLRMWFDDGVSGFIPLAPDQPLTSVPYAVTAGQLAGPLPASGLSGSYANPVQLTNQANTLVGNGSGLTALNATALASGVIPDARLGASIARVTDVWQLGGNAGTAPASDFLGTTDSAALVLRANNQPVVRLEGQPSGVRIIAGRNSNVSTLSTNSMILGGRDNTIGAQAHESVIAGGLDNVIGENQRSAFIGGGARNEIQLDNQHAVIVGGRDNRIGTNVVISLVVGGGENHLANNVDGGLMVGGFRNDVLGSPNPNRREIAPVLIGGSDNEIGRESSWTVILGGDNNRIGTNCPSTVILGGTNNLVADNAGYSLAAGRRCRVNHVGAIMFADSQNASFASAGENTFNIRAEGGVHLSGDTSQFYGSSVRQMINLWSTRYGIGVQSSTFYSRTDEGGSFSWFRGGVHSNSANSPGTGGVEMMRLNSGGLRVNGTFVSASDRALKEHFEPLDPEAILERVVALPLNTWNYRQDPGVRHLGPTAQDFHAAFGVGMDDKHIATVDADGVALAAIQGLHRKVEAENAALRQENAELRRRLEALESRLH